MEVSALRHGHLQARFGTRSPLFRLQSDERLVALVRKGNHAAFETLVARYHTRLASFCRHMLGSKEDAEDVLQEVFVAAYNALRADDREVMVRPWLYRIARNRSLNHLRRQQPIGVDSMDVHLSDFGRTTADEVHRREDFRLLMVDVSSLAETQRTALLLREMEHLSYEQIAVAMETTVPAVKSLLVRARMSLAEASEARALSCDEVRLELAEASEGVKKVSPPVRRHVRDCERCAEFRTHLRQTNKALAVLFPAGPLIALKGLLAAHFGSAASSGSGAAAGGTAAGGAASAGSAVSAGGLGAVASASSMAGSAASAGLGAVATKAAVGLAAAAVVTAGAVEVRHATSEPARPAPIAASAARHPAAPERTHVRHAPPKPPVAAATILAAAREKVARPAPNEAETPAANAAPQPEPTATTPTATTPATTAATTPVHVDAPVATATGAGGVQSVSDTATLPTPVPPSEPQATTDAATTTAASQQPAPPPSAEPSEPQQAPVAPAHPRSTLP
jgi:RNA polymerase sigma factor (sigma-70 family)